VRSTAVGFVKLAPDIHVGGKVAKGALVATVDVLGVAVEVRADHGGIVAKLRCATGDPVEYGQELFLVESVGEVKA
jgi:acetyl-CoA carboxylase biotin carboxyl carrier protein